MISNNKTPFAIINHWMGGNDDYMNSPEYCQGVIGQKASDGTTHHYVNYGTSQRNVRRMFCYKSAEESYYPPIVIPESFPSSVKNHIVLQNNPPRLKAIMDKRNQSVLPIGIVNDNHSCALNAVFRLLLDIPQMNELLSEIVRSMVNENLSFKENQCTILLSFVYCGRSMFEKADQSNLSPNERHISISSLSVALNNKVRAHDQFHNDHLVMKKDEPAGNVIRVFLNYLWKELSSIAPAISDRFSGFFKKKTLDLHRCSRCSEESWQTLYDRNDDCFTLPLAIPQEIDASMDLMYASTEKDCFDIHLQDAIRLCSKKIERGEDCRFKAAIRKRFKGQRLMKCEVATQRMFRESPPNIIVELNRAEIVSSKVLSQDKNGEKKRDTCVFVPKQIYITVKQTANDTIFVNYNFVSAICLGTDGQNKDYYYVMKSQDDSSFLKIWDEDMKVVDNKLAWILFRKSHVFFYSQRKRQILHQRREL